MSAASFDALGMDRDLGSEAYRPADFPGCEVVPPAGERDRPLRRPSGVLGRRHRDGLEGLRAHLHSARAAVPAARADGGTVRDDARLANRKLRLGGPGAPGRGGAQALADAGRRGAVPAHGPGVRLQGPAIDVDADPLPDVVLEVDHTTDVRRRKLGIYKESGFPEIWVLVPWEASVRRPGLTIHVRRGGEYREEGESRAFPGWKAEEIHRALTEAPMSETAWRALERTALAMGGARGYDAAARSAHGVGERKGAGKRSRPGSPGGSRARSPGRPHGRCGRYPRIPGDRADPGHDEAPGAVQRNSGNGRGGGSAGVYERDRLPATNPRAARHAWAERPHPAASTGTS